MHSMWKKILRSIWRTISIVTVILGVLGIHQVHSDIAMWQDVIRGVPPISLFIAMLIGGLLLGEGLRSTIGIAASLREKYSAWLRSEDISWGVHVRGFIRHPEEYFPPAPKFVLGWKKAIVREPWRERIVRGTDSVWLAVAFARRSPILNRFRIRTPVEIHRLDAWNAGFSESETRHWHSDYRPGDKFFRYRITKTGGFSGPIPLDPVLRSEYTSICEVSLGIVETQTVAFEIADIDCMRELLIVYTIDNAGIGVRFPTPGCLTTIPDADDRSREIRESEGVVVQLARTNRKAERGCKLPHTVENGCLQCLLAFRQAPRPNKNPRFVDELVIVTNEATRGALTVYWK